MDVRFQKTKTVEYSKKRYFNTLIRLIQLRYFDIFSPLKYIFFSIKSIFFKSKNDVMPICSASNGEYIFIFN